MPARAWDDDMVATLKRLYADGLSARQIAAAIGGLSRSAVIGKAHRLGISSPESQSQIMKRTRRKKRAMVPQARRRTKRIIPFEPLLEPLPLPQADDVARKGFADLDERDCRFPVGDPGQPGFGFCACPKVPGTSYCAGHLMRAFQIPRNVSDADRARRGYQLRRILGVRLAMSLIADARTLDPIDAIANAGERIDA